MRIETIPKYIPQHIFGTLSTQENVIYIKKNIVTPPSSVGGEGEFSKIVEEDFHKKYLSCVNDHFHGFFVQNWTKTCQLDKVLDNFKFHRKKNEDKKSMEILVSFSNP